jgi:formate-dependent phosphoribosylglycinamide formyltransferase (GAR transformylase)
VCWWIGVTLVIRPLATLATAGQARLAKLVEATAAFRESDTLGGFSSARVVAAQHCSLLRERTIVIEDRCDLRL